MLALLRRLFGHSNGNGHRRKDTGKVRLEAAREDQSRAGQKQRKAASELIEACRATKPVKARGGGHVRTGSAKPA